MKWIFAIAAASLPNLGNTEILLMCGPSQGYAYFFKDEIWNPEGGDWAEDGISNGQIILTQEGQTIDIAFGDALGSFSYLADGASLFSTGTSENQITILAVNDSYTDIYTFDFVNREVAWSSHKLGPLAPKAATYLATCR